MNQIVQARATAVAASRAAAPQIADGGCQQYLTFMLGGEMFAVGILGIKEIIEFGGITEIPMMPPFIRGVINLRGSVVPVIDLAARFGSERSAIGKRSCIVIVEVMSDDFRHDIGIMVDAVSEVLEIPDSDIEPPPSFGARIRADFIQGMGKAGRQGEGGAGRFVIILNIDRVLSVEEIGVLAAAGSQGGNHGDQ